MSKRVKFVQIAASEAEEEVGTLYALADDGSIWMMISPWKGDAEWQEIEPPWMDDDA